ncbi:PAS domain S-box protein [Streptomyces roseolilacinus]|uniref:PAS domain S-box protein n=1 Tax=Streptomyces roseolilacinus TaxID=66904 RepID=UPI0038193559
MDSGTPRAVSEPAPEEGRVPLAVVVVDHEGRISHWSTGARRLFGPSREEAVGRPAADLLPVSGALADDEVYGEDGAYGEYEVYGEGEVYGGGARGPRDAADGPDAASREPYPAAGYARLTVPGRERADVLWWAYPLSGPGRGRLLVLAADAARYRGGPGGGPGRAVAPGFAPHTEFEGADELARRLPEVLPDMSVREATGIVARILELGHPVLEFGHRVRVPVTPGRGVPRHVAGGGAVPGAGRDAADEAARQAY